MGVRQSGGTPRGGGLRLLALLLGTGLLVPLAVSAQEREAPAVRGPVQIIGQVVEVGSGAAVSGATVTPRDRRETVVTDEEGRFFLGEVRPGERLQVSMLGYEPGEAAVPSGGGPLTIELEPDPVLLEGLRILADRFEERRRSVGHTVRVFDRIALLQTEYHNVLDLIERRTRLSPAPCPGMTSVSECTRQRGGFRPVVVYVDESEADLQHLRGYSPDDMYLVEVYRSGSHIRAYTNWWVERIGKRGQDLAPFQLPRIRMEHQNSLFPPR